MGTLSSPLIHMQYTEVSFCFSFEEEYLQDMFYQGLCDLGFESFMDDKAYIQTALLDEEAVRQYAAENGQTVISFKDCPDENWNATWEAEHPVEDLPLGVRITPHCAFGAGHHETTGMMIEALLENGETDSLRGRNVLDMGCGTGVLAIFAKKLGASEVVAVDIDDKSVVNTLENAELNGVNLDVRLGSEIPEGNYNLILANIHRNVLLSMMADFGRTLLPGGDLFLSGFYEEDIPPLLESAAEQGLWHVQTRERGEWRMLHLQR